jgi:hypothetical protein
LGLGWRVRNGFSPHRLELLEVGVSDRKVSDQDRERERTVREEEDERLAEMERRGEQLREAWRQRHQEAFATECNALKKGYLSAVRNESNPTSRYWY